MQWINWTTLILIMAVVSFYREKDADFINESSFTIVSTITQVDDRYIYYRFKFEDEYYNSSFRIKQKYDGLLSKGDKLFVRFATDNPEINFCIFPQLRSANQFATNLVLDTLNTELVSAGWIGNNPHNHYSR